MQFSTFFATAVAMAVGSNASVIKGRQEALATLEAYNFSTCDVDSVLTVEIVDQDCHDFDHGYGNAQATLTDPEQNCMLTLYSEEDCNGEIYFQKPGTCNKNIDGLARLSYALTCA